MRERIFIEDDLASSSTGARACIPCRLAESFASHLQQHRESISAPLVHGHASSPHPGSILIPHFAAVALGPKITEVTLWELMPLALFASWRPDGVTSDDVAWLVKHMHDVIATRTMIHGGRSPWSQELREALEAGRYLSAKLCLEMREALVAEWAR